MSEALHIARFAPSSIADCRTLSFAVNPPKPPVHVEFIITMNSSPPHPQVGPVCASSNECCPLPQGTHHSKTEPTACEGGVCPMPNRKPNSGVDSTPFDFRAAHSQMMGGGASLAPHEGKSHHSQTAGGADTAAAGVCPVPHDSASAQRWGAMHPHHASHPHASNPASSSAAVCPVPHGPSAIPGAVPTGSIPMSASSGAVCPVPHGSSAASKFAAMAAASSSSSSVTSTSPHAATPASTCTSLSSDTQKDLTHVERSSSTTTTDNLLQSSAACAETKVQFHRESFDADDIVPPQTIPASGRGNSEDGSSWLNPSANQLYRALMRKEKPIEKEQAWVVSQVHVAVTESTWSSIMEYENMHLQQ